MLSIIFVIRHYLYPSIIVVVFVICCLCYPLSFIVVIFIIHCLFHLYQKVVSPNSLWIHNFCHLLSSLSVIFVIHYSCYQLSFYPLFFPFVSLSKSSITNFFADRQFAWWKSLVFFLLNYPWFCVTHFSWNVKSISLCL